MNAETPTRTKTLAFVLFLLAFTVVLTEVGLRVLGRRPWAVVPPDIRVEPGGRFFTSHPDLGYTHLAGSFRVTLATGYSFNVTHLPSTLRVTHPPRAENGARPEVWIFGCSATHGWSVNDQETYPWLLQERLPDVEVTNFGVDGYGTLQSLIQFRAALRQGPPPEVVVIAYASFHDERNTFTRSRRKTVAPFNTLGPLSQPRARLDPDGRLRISMAEVSYTEFPLMRYLAIAHDVERVYNRLESLYYRSHKVSELLIEEFRGLCEANKCRLVVAGLWNDPETVRMLEWCKRRGIATVDISVDMTNPAHTNLPHDSHPSALAHSKYADALYQFLSERGMVNSSRLPGR